MSPLLLSGLAAFCVGFLLLAAAGPMSMFAAKHPIMLESEDDRGPYRKRKLFIVRFVGSAWVLMGAGLCLYALITGK